MDNYNRIKKVFQKKYYFLFERTRLCKKLEDGPVPTRNKEET